MKKAIAICLFVSLLSCEGSEGHFNYFYSRSSSLSPEERQALLPNKLFIALADQKKEGELQKIVNQNGQYLYALNENQDTPLGVAVKFYNLKGALFVASQMNPESYLHQNLQGEGYLYLASQKGYVGLIQLLAHRFYESQQELLLDYEFSELDMRTHKGERALHVARNHATAEALEYEYWRGTLEVPLRKFQYLQNDKEQTFLHTAVRDQNSNLLRWGLDQICSSQKEWEDSAFYYRWLGLAWRSIQSYGKAVWLDWDDIINTQDDQGRTAINFSAQNLFLEGIRILSSCQWTDYLLSDDKGNIPLQNFLLALDPLKQEYEQEVREVFVLLVESRTRLTWSGLSEHVNSSNEEGNSSLHISARLADTFFYNRLKQYGDIEQKNLKGQTPREIFESKRNLLKGRRSY